ncbi:MAG: hypothetical protein EOO74_07500 [Myxococcales bacterium]|nr:MAG: hypothetical protein EOO74_07500 [Myxococcales bacterium]
MDSVSRTRIFARMLSPGRQLLAYAMHYRAAGELAMILPLPVPPGSGEDAVRFIDLSGHPSFFADLEQCFRTRRAACAAPGGSPASLLRVHDVGSFEVSFVPTLADFARLDPRFRLADDVATALPHGADRGFVVVQLREREGQLHPIAFDFPTCRPDHLFYPTVHVHDGTVPDHADFEHTLYAQHRDARPFLRWQPWTTGFRRAFLLAWEAAHLEPTVAASSHELLAMTQPIHRIRVDGSWPNVDLWVPL